MKKLCRLSPWSKMQSRKFCRNVDKVERNHISMSSKKTSVSLVCEKGNKPKVLKWNFQAKIVSRQTGWKNAAVSFKKQIEKQADMEHSRKSWQFRSRKISPQRAKLKVSEEKPDLQEIIHFRTRGGNLVINLPKIEHEYREESYDSAIFFLFSLPCFR